MKERVRINARNPDMRDEAVLGFALRDASFAISRETFEGTLKRAISSAEAQLLSLAFFGAANRHLAKQWIQDLPKCADLAVLKASPILTPVNVPGIESLGLAATESYIETVSCFL